MKAAFALALALMAGPAWAQSAAELLQKAIYTQDTVGDIDGALKIYRQVVASAAESRSAAAQAQYRIGLCLLKKGDRTGATQAFAELTKNFADQKDLVAKAREATATDSSLLAAPWTEGELLEYRMILGGGKELGVMLLSVERSTERPQNLILQNRIYMWHPHQFTQVEVDSDTMRPVASSGVSALLGEFTAAYEAKQARYQQKGKEARSIALSGLTYDNEEAVFLLRRLPLTVGYRSAVPLVTPAGMLLTFTTKVLGEEDVQVPAGKFHCWKLEFEGVGQRFYINTEAPRQIVKIEAGGVDFELRAVRTVDRTAAVEYRDKVGGLTVTATPGWVFRDAGNPKAGETSVTMLDPLARGFAAVWAENTTGTAETLARDLRVAAEQRVQRRGTESRNYRLRAGSEQASEAGGIARTSAVFDYVEAERKMVEYTVWLGTAKSRAMFFARASAADFDEFRPRFDAIVNTAKID